MKQLLYWIFLFFSFYLNGQTNLSFRIQVGTFVNPQLQDFNDLRPLGLVHAELVADNFYKVFVGEFTSEYEALNTLASVQERGYGGFISRQSLQGKPEVTVVQFTTKNKADVAIDWANLNIVGKIYALLTDSERIKFVTGPFADEATARKRVAEIQKMGYPDAFVKTINAGLLHPIGPFEMGIDPVQKNLNTAVEAIINDGLPSSYEAIPTVPSLSTAAVETAKSGLVPAIRPLIKRTSALDIQKVLKANKYYAGSLDGFYGKGTQKGYQNFVEQNPIYQKYELWVNQSADKIGTAPTGIQAAINKLLQNPSASIAQLRTLNTPLASAYRAYWLLVNNGSIVDINQLMNDAIKATFADKKIKNAPPFDFSANYSYEDLTQLLLHLRYLHAAPMNADIALPCWLFERHPKETLAAFKTKSKFASFANTQIDACQGFDEWPSIKIMRAMIEDLQAPNLSEAQQKRQETLDAARNFQYLFPEKLTKEQKRETDEWLRNFWLQLESSGQAYPVLGKNLAPLKVLFFQSQVLLEDYFMNKEFTPDAAEGMALSVLKTYVEVPLEVYGL